MSKKFYLPRILSDETKSYSETELLSSSRHIIVLAEPGGGKTRLLESLASQLHAKRVTANVFKHTNSPTHSEVLVLDAFDEVAKVDPSGIYQLLAKALDTGAKQVIISSRSSEWDEASTHRFKEFFGAAPTVVRLTAFNEEEQNKLFDHHVPGEDFNQFQTEVGRFDLEPLLPNPKFLELFADAYVEGGRHFTSKSSIFALAVDRLAREANESVSQKGSATLEKKVEIAAEVFAKLLLSGSEGVSFSDANSDRLYPRLISLAHDEVTAECILDTRLFKPGDKTDQHQPVHKIVAEYCAAKYLVGRIANDTDALSLRQCLAIIAPNGTVRDELRGMLGWMAALGDKSVQEAAIELDPYASAGDLHQVRLSWRHRYRAETQADAGGGIVSAAT